MIKKGYQSINKDDNGNPIDISNTIKKLYDHVSLDIARITYLSSKEKITSPEYVLDDLDAKVKAIGKEEQSLNNKFNEIKEKMKSFSDKTNKLQRVRKINRVNAIIAKFLTILKLQPNSATLRSDLTQAVR